MHLTRNKVNPLSALLCVRTYYTTSDSTLLALIKIHIRATNNKENSNDEHGARGRKCVFFYVLLPKIQHPLFSIV